ncbi:MULTISPECIES: adenine deaminase [Methylomonas]|uniref:Adenine deaminase n=2 Tax=Methylomonas TaxID=416 RepID=A0A126T582_9GAMM|nr:MULTISPECIES: adenine deaminase [Methylomonas]AMK76894.1 adenosine deaminase [Methylomonas denitrificans]OAI09139.1 adenine deaminase [Methylomonas methanica]TCV74199.1 adenine deaminase [Methylomonas methanica]
MSHPYDGSITANIVRITSKRIVVAEIQWRDGVISALSELRGEDARLPYLIPGFIDAHVHIESSMLTPSEFARLAVRHGTVATVSDPHEIANVLGVPGVQYMLDNANQTPFKFFFGAPSCVPATPFETAGARIDCDQLQSLYQTQQIRYLSEMMNYPGVLASDPDILAKLDLARRQGFRIDGHAPGLVGKGLARYAEAGISSDHECTELTEAEEKLACGMAILIREGSAARNFDALHSLISRFPNKVMFCSDDKHPDDLLAGHINSLAARAIAKGHDLFAVLQCACLNPIDHYGLPVGRLRVGDSMDAVLLENLQTLQPINTWIAGQLVASHGRSLLPSIKPQALNHFLARKVVPTDLEIADPGGLVRVIKALDDQLFTQQLLVEPNVCGGKVVADIKRDILWLVVVNRYQPCPPAVALIQGFGLRQGALASSVAHDSHNIIAVGCDAETLCLAVNSIVDSQGGIISVCDGKIHSLPLPIAGLMSDADGDWVAARYAALDSVAKRMGSTLSAPFMTLSFMALLVIPELKLSDQGLFDSRRFQFTSLAVQGDQAKDSAN